MPNTKWTLLTAGSQGAIAILQLTGEVEDALCKLTGKTSWEDGALHLVDIPEIDEVIAVKLNNTLAHIMPHGGMHVLRLLAERFANIHIEQTYAPCYPEAEDVIEEAMLKVLPLANSPLAVDLLLQQPTKLRGAIATVDDIARSTRLNHLIVPPKVVLLGAPNTGKSTLMNALTRQDTSIVHDLPGATRDAVGARVNCAGLVIDLYDLPGFHTSEDTIEQEAIALATTIANEASLTVLIADTEHDWIMTEANNTLHVCTKTDIALRSDAAVCVSAFEGEGMQQLSVAIRDALVPPSDLQSERPWFFTGYTPIEE